MQRSEVYRRSRRGEAPVQCVADHGMHKDAPADRSAGIVLADAPPTAEEVARFMAFVQKLPCGCWFWTGARSRGKGNRQWYGSFWFRGRSVRAHIFAHDHLAGKHCPPGWHRDHECRFSLCVCPDHVEARPPEANQARVREPDLVTLARMAEDSIVSASSRKDRHYDSLGYCDNPGRGY